MKNRCRPLLLLAMTALAGCAAPLEVRSVAAGGAAPAFELRGPRLASLDAQAQRLCPDGHVVIRQSQRLHLQAGDAGLLRRWLGHAEEAAGLVEDGHAQLLVQCTSAPSPSTPPTPPSTPPTPS